ncbi:MAG TPA: S8 family serine peptidase [Gammaproteobacteria bacterium]|nr:S8 family serine peptidase [Gammaproteobacteria bacterium]
MFAYLRYLSRTGAAFLLGAILGTTPSLALASAGDVDQPLTRPQTSLHIGEPLSASGQRAAIINRDVEVFVRLSQPSVSRYVRNEMDAGRARPSKSSQRSYADKLRSEHNSVRSSLEGMGARIDGSLRVGANGILAKVRLRDLPQIKQLPGVEAVTQVLPQKPTLEQSVPWIGAPEVWSEFGDGAGVRVAIIDTGIDYTHADFGGPGTVAAFTSNNPDTIEAGTFPTAKVVGGYDFAGADYDAGDPAHSIPTPDPDPLDEVGHGTHVAGIAAGEGVPGNVGPGVAKGALLYAYKIFGDHGGSTNLTSLGIERALDPNQDGSVDDHVDVINMSLGSDFSGPDDPSAISANNAAALGVIVVASAGNGGNIPYITGAPAVAPNAISVAASVTGGTVLALQVNAPAPIAGKYEAVEAAITPTLASTGPKSGGLAVSQPLNGCSPLTNAPDMIGNLALIQRGTCNFSVKILYVQAAGAIGVVVFNNVSGAPITMGGSSAGISIPAEMISLDDGTLIATALGGSPGTGNIAADITTDTKYGDTIASFSSRGPGQGGSQFKPDVTAPGVAIVSAGMGTGDGSATLSGTSMASPHIAGVAALLRPIFPALQPTDIKALIQNSAVTANANGIGTDSPYPLTLQGTGVVRADRAANLTSFAKPGGVSFGRVNPAHFDTQTVKVEIRNLSNKNRVFNVTQVPNQVFPGVSISGPSQIHVSPHASKKMLLKLSMNPSVGPYDTASFSQTEVDGWFMLDDGTDQLRVGYLAVVDPASDIKLNLEGWHDDQGKHGLHGNDRLKFRNNGASTGFADGFTLAGLDGQLSDNTPASIRALGFRTAAISGYGVVDFGLATDNPWETLSSRLVQIFLDIDKDGVDDVELDMADGSLFGLASYTGIILTAQFDLHTGAGFLDWIVSGADYNDAVAIMPFTRAADGGLVPDEFNYTLVVSDFNNSVDVQQGEIVLGDEIVPSLASFGLLPGGSTTVDTNGVHGRMLWLFQNNEVKRQAQTANVH